LKKLNLRDILFRNSIIIDLKKNSKDKVLRDLALFISSLHTISDPESIVSGIISREEETSTGIGLGIAVPHYRTDLVDKIHLAVARCKDGMAFDALDDKPVNLIFMLIVPKDHSESYQEILQTISGIMLIENVREALIKTDNPDDFIKILSQADESYTSSK
jgi:mannitol/fructose-specific phosphotransferase system IIA component (Ntr-type)